MSRGERSGDPLSLNPHSGFAGCPNQRGKTNRKKEKKKKKASRTPGKSLQGARGKGLTPSCTAHRGKKRARNGGKPAWGKTKSSLSEDRVPGGERSSKQDGAHDRKRIKKSLAQSHMPETPPKEDHREKGREK